MKFGVAVYSKRYREHLILLNTDSVLEMILSLVLWGYETWDFML